MILKRIKLKNIRSYEYLDMEFKRGITLLMGDIGSGKSTILYAIEFAIFGFGDVGMEFLLRHGKNQGIAEVSVDINGKEYTFHREIHKRREKVSQKNLWILGPEGKEELSVTEMRKRAIQIFGFKESESARSKSVIYRYAIFTPQEEMKSLLMGMDKTSIEERLKTIRKIFGAEDYKVAADNAKKFVKDVLKKYLTWYEAKAEGKEDKEKELKEMEKEIDDVVDRMEKLRGKLPELEEQYKSRKIEIESMEKIAKRISDMEKIIEGISKEILEKKRNIEELNEEINKIECMEKEVEKVRDDAKKYEGMKKRFDDMIAKERKLRDAEKDAAKVREKIKSCEERIKRNRKKIERFERELEKVAVLKKKCEYEEKFLKKLDEIRDKIAEFTHKNRDFKRKIDELKEEKDTYLELKGKAKCPKCGQDLSDEHLKKMIENIEKEIEYMERKAEEYNEKILQMKSEENDIKNKVDDIEDAKRNLLRLEHIKMECEELKGESTDLKRDIKKLNNVLEGYEIKLKDLETIRKEIASVEKEMKSLEIVYNNYKRLLNLIERKSDVEEKIKKLIEDVRHLNNTFNQMNEELKMLREKYDDECLRRMRDDAERISREIAASKKELFMLERSFENIKKIVEKIKEEIEEMNNAEKEIKRLSLIKIWLEEVYVYALRVLEESFMNHLRSEFRDVFKKKFVEIIEDEEIDVDIDETFTPVIHQNGYEISWNALSGGEKTSVALAYRLALNHLVNRGVSSMKENLLIFDEPTDGFSTEQLERVVEVIRNLKTAQILIVTHEEELKPMADHLYMVKKEGGKSKIWEES